MFTPPKRWEMALALFAEMPARSVEANIAIYNAAISACEKANAGRWLRANDHSRLEWA